LDRIWEVVVDPKRSRRSFGVPEQALEALLRQLIAAGEDHFLIHDGRDELRVMRVYRRSAARKAARRELDAPVTRAPQLP
jgi:hypothetical protein